MSTKRKIAIIYCIAALIFSLFVILAVFPFLKGIKTGHNEILDMKKGFSDYKEQQNKYSELKEQYNAIESGFDNLLIDPEAPIEIIKFWEKMASDSGVKIDILANNSKKEDKILWNYMEFQIKITGSFYSALKFIKKLETEPYLVEISSLSIAKTSEVQANSGAAAGAKKENKQIIENVSCNISVKVYTKSQ